MNKLGNKGFTLVELIATIVVLALVMGIGSYSITAVIKKAREKDYDLLIENVKSAAETYYQECRYASSDAVNCPAVTKYNGYDSYQVTLGNLVEYGFLEGNSTIKDGSNKDKQTLVNPNDKVNISNCDIRFYYTDGKVVVQAVDVTGSCPTSY